MEAVHVELPDERAKVAVFEEARQELFTEPVGRGDCAVRARGELVHYWGRERWERTKERVSVVAPPDQVVCGLICDHAVIGQRGGQYARPPARPVRRCAMWLPTAEQAEELNMSRRDETGGRCAPVELVEEGGYAPLRGSVWPGRDWSLCGERRSECELHHRRTRTERESERAGGLGLRAESERA